MKKIVIAGAGFGGVRVALDLAKSLPEEKIIIINDSPYHCYKSDLYEILSVKLHGDNRVQYKNILGSVNIPLSRIFGGFKNIQLYVSPVRKIDLNRKSVETAEETLGYDYLVVGLGCKTCFYGIKGAQSYAHMFSNAEDALNVRNDLTELFERKKDACIVIVGGGFTGTEISGELATVLPKDRRIKLVEAQEFILSGMPGWAKKTALKRLQQIGVEVLTGHGVKEVLQGKIITDQGEIDYDYLIWVAGVMGQSIEKKVLGNIEVSKNNRIKVDPDLSIQGHKNAFALGDVAGEFPTTSWAALGQAKVVAKNIERSISGKPTSDYNPPNSVYIVPVGRNFAISNAFGLELSGFFAWILKRIITLRYFISILPLPLAFVLWYKGIRVMNVHVES